MKLKELKSKVYELADVKSTKQLKVKYKEFKALDMRRKISWQKVLKSLEKQTSDLQTWLDNPPEEYREIFTEIQALSVNHDQNNLKSKQLVQNLQIISNSLEATANELQDEAVKLENQNKLASKLNEQAKLN